MIFPPLSYETFRLLNYIWIGVGAVAFIILLKIKAPYGRHASLKWGPMIDNRLAWFIMEIPVLLIVFSFAFLKNQNLSLPIAIMGVLFCSHYIYRSIVFPFRLRTKGKKMPVVIMSAAVLFNLLNGFFIGYYLRNYAHYDTSWLSDFRFITGVILFITGFLINLISDTMLISLRAHGETTYKIPVGFLFERISCPNHFGEMLEWLGFAILCWNLPAASFFIWTVLNLLPRSLAHHRWYHEKFPLYPKDRRAVIPFVL